MASTGLTRRICEALQIQSTAGMVSAVYNKEMDRSKLAALAPAVVEAARDGDDPSILGEILEPAGHQLAEMVEAVAGQLDLPKVGLPLAAAGSFLLNCPAVAGAMVGRLIERGMSVFVSEVREPVEGAVVLARREWSSR
jgi:N-acetylglucosamine kinase-like BadF-type ATPase